MAKNQKNATATTADARWTSVVARDASADGAFVYSVKTTGVYCRPSCAARLARPENVLFYRTCGDAEAAGFRPCKRCKPDEPSLVEQHASTIASICRLIEASDETSNLNELAKRAGMSAFHFHRVFKAITGVTPKAYAAATRENRVREKLSSGRTVTEAIYDAGYNSNARFYEKSNQILGMKPSQYRTGGVNGHIRFAVGESSLGSILVASSDRGICAIFLGDDPNVLARELQDRFPHANLIGGDENFEQLVARVVAFVETPAVGFDLPLDVRGTVFQQRVWRALQDIPCGSTASYSDIANRIGNPKAVRAVAQACGANHLAVVIPCHRVVRHDGGLSGYHWGVERKRKLLEREAGA
jgi:AraC family transcriptional regulator of adaptative response/methylated-DNA-[protein]-cysteine methyltransferase